MTSRQSTRQTIRRLIAREPVPRCGFWLGNPHPDTIALLNRRLGTTSLEEIQLMFGDDVRWITPQHHLAATYRHPQGKSMRPWRDVNPYGLTGQGLLTEASTIEDFERIDFPDPKYLDFTHTLSILDAAGDFYRLSGFWAPFFHDLCYLFGTEELLTLLLMEPDFARRAIDRICTFYFEANERFYAVAGDRIDAFFFGNDFGTQESLMLSPALFRECFLPWIARFAQQAHAHGYQCVLHSCGSIVNVIDDLIDAGIDCLHPMQTAARDMSAESLARRFGDRVTFMGGVDTQDLLQNGAPADVDQAVHQLLAAFGNNIIIGPSHEALLPTVNVENVLQMVRAVKGIQFPRTPAG
jgi:uroporphyrinogen decarboxylase